MPILVDFSQISLAGIAAEKAANPNVPLEPALAKHFIINSLRMNTMKFKGQYGKVYLCVDSTSWRKSYFPLYKARRAEDRKDDEEFWKLVYQTVKETADLLDEFSPYPVIRVPGAEADDIIAWLTRKFAAPDSADDDFGGFGQETAKPEKVLILSGDKDFQQLQILPNVDQYSPTLKKNLKCKDPRGFFMEHIARGDAGDGVPNVLSADNCLIDKIRQTPIMEKFVTEFKAGFENPETIEVKKISKELFLQRFDRNKKLIDLIHGIPKDVEASIEEVYIRETETPRGNLETLRQAFIANRMKNMLDVIGDFRNK